MGRTGTKSHKESRVTASEDCSQDQSQHWQFIISSHAMQPVQVLASSWATTRGGLVPKMLNPNVTRGAANVASVRRLRNLVHGAIALKSLRALKVGLRPTSTAAVSAYKFAGPSRYQALFITMTAMLSIVLAAQAPAALLTAYGRHLSLPAFQILKCPCDQRH